MVFRVALKDERAGGNALLPRKRGRAAEQGRVPDVHPVKIAEGEYDRRVGAVTCLRRIDLHSYISSVQTDFRCGPSGRSTAVPSPINAPDAPYTLYSPPVSAPSSLSSRMTPPLR